MEKKFEDMTYEERREYVKTLPINEEGYKAIPKDIGMTIEEYMEKNGGISWEDFNKKISNKYNV